MDESLTILLWHISSQKRYSISSGPGEQFMSSVPQVRFGLAQNVSRCPSCDSSSIYRSRRYGAFEMILGRILLLYPYRCQRCDARFYIFGQRRLPDLHPKPQPSGSLLIP